MSVVGGDVGDVEMSKADGMMDENDDSAAPTSGAVLADDGEIPEIRVFGERKEF